MCTPEVRVCFDVNLAPLTHLCVTMNPVYVPKHCVGLCATLTHVHTGDQCIITLCPGEPADTARALTGTGAALSRHSQLLCYP